jgi:AcrR family transcriptional regulator
MPTNDAATPTNDEARPSTASPRERIMAAAAKLFAQKGLHGAGLREIAREAMVNVNLIAYHFKTKEELYAQVIEATANELNSARDIILEALDHRYSPGVPPVSEIMYAFVHPVFTIIERDEQVWRYFLGAYRRETSTDIWNDVNKRTTVPVMRRFTTALHRSLPSAKRSDVIFVLELAIQSLAISEEASSASMLGESLAADRAPQDLESQLIRGLTAAAACFL